MPTVCFPYRQTGAAAPPPLRVSCSLVPFAKTSKKNPDERENEKGTTNREVAAVKLFVSVVRVRVRVCALNTQIREGEEHARSSYVHRNNCFLAFFHSRVKSDAHAVRRERRKKKEKEKQIDY